MKKGLYITFVQSDWRGCQSVWRFLFSSSTTSSRFCCFGPSYFLLMIWLTAFAAITPVAYADDGVPLWTNRFYGPVIGGFDQANGLTVDTNGDVYVTGSISTGYQMSAVATVKYSSAGVPLWTNVFGGQGNGGSGAAVAIDKNGTVFVTGWARVVNAFGDLVTLAYSSAGSPLWTNTYNGPGNLDDAANALAVSANGNIIAAGQTSGGQMRYGYMTIAYGSDGRLLWSNVYAGDSYVDVDSYAKAVTTDVNNNVLVTGYSTGNGFDYCTIAYTSNGTRLWKARYNGSANGADYARAIATDTNGNVFVTGYALENSTGYDYVTLKYSSAGVPLWTNRFNRAGNGYDIARAIALDNAGNVLVTGYSTNGSSGYDYATISYSNMGIPQWTNFYGGTGNKDDFATAIGVDGLGNVFVTGRACAIPGNYDYVTVAYSKGGLPLWTNRYDDPDGAYDEPTTMAVDGGGNVLVAGYAFGDYLTVKYSAIQPVAYLNMARADNGLILYWEDATYRLQMAGTFDGIFTNIPGAASPYTNSFSQSQQYFRLGK